MPEQRGEQESGRDRFAGAYAPVGICQREHDETFAERLLEDDVEQRQQAVVQPFLAQALKTFDRVAGGQQLQHLVKQA